MTSFSPYGTSIEYIAQAKTDSFVVHFPGRLFVQDTILSIPLPTSITIESVVIFRGVTGSSGNLKIDVKQGSFGTLYTPVSIFSDPSHRPNIASSEGDDATAYSTNTSDIVIPALSVLTVSIDEIEGGVPEDLFVIIYYKDS